jgi:hypothetical protein
MHTDASLKGEPREGCLSATTAGGLVVADSRFCDSRQGEVRRDHLLDHPKTNFAASLEKPAQLLQQLEGAMEVNVPNGAGREEGELCCHAATPLSEPARAALQIRCLRRRGRFLVRFRTVLRPFDSRWGHTFQPAIPASARAVRGRLEEISASASTCANVMNVRRRSWQRR